MSKLGRVAIYVDVMIDKVIVPVILNIFPREFDIDKYFYDERETEVIREY